MDIKYDFQLDLDTDNSHAHQLRAVPPGSRVVEFGCATGYLSRYMSESLRCRVTGVDISAEYAERARPYCERVVVGDLDALDFGAVFEGERYDVALFGDVLEHLKDPRRVLEATRAILNPDGRVIATIPNVAHGDVRMALLAGRFEYQRLGLLDDTHLRFFTYASIKALFEATGFAVVRIERIRQPLFQTELGVDPALVPPGVVEQLNRDPEATTYQFVVIAAPAGESGELRLLNERVADLETHKSRLEAELADSRGQLGRLEAELAAARSQAEEARQAALAAAEEARREAEARLTEATCRHEAERAQLQHTLETARKEAADWHGHFADLEPRFRRLRALSFVNPLVIADTLLRRLTKS